MSSSSPAHYTQHLIQPIDFIEMNNLGFSVGNVIKYVCRFQEKNGLEDLKKAQKYLDFLIEKQEGGYPSEASDD